MEKSTIDWSLVMGATGLLTTILFFVVQYIKEHLNKDENKLEKRDEQLEKQKEEEIKEHARRIGKLFEYTDSFRTKLERMESVLENLSKQEEKCSSEVKAELAKLNSAIMTLATSKAKEIGETDVKITNLEKDIEKLERRFDQFMERIDRKFDK